MTPDRIPSRRRSADGSETRCLWALPECCWRSLALLLDREQFLRSYLFAYLYWTGMALGCLAILLMHHVVGGKWGMLIRRLCEAGARTLPFMVLLLIPILFGMPTLYIRGRGPRRRTMPIFRAKRRTSMFLSSSAAPYSISPSGFCTRIC